MKHCNINSCNNLSYNGYCKLYKKKLVEFILSPSVKGYSSVFETLPECEAGLTPYIVENHGEEIVICGA